METQPPASQTVEGALRPVPSVHTRDAEEAVKILLRYVGEDPDRDGLQDTPKRVAKAWREMTTGYDEDPEAILSRVFEVKHNQMVVVTGIRFTSLCEHHVLPFVGTATVGYVPGDKVVGLSKIARLVLCFARRLQVQERLTDEIADAMMDHLKPRGVGVIVKAHHSCMGCRGVAQPEAVMVTSAVRGAISENPATRAELLSLSQ